jgi:8-oxo-dGTP diphosphatase
LVEVVAAVIVDNGEYLACRRHADRGGRWEFPGGKVEQGEDGPSALRREIAEELGVAIRVGELLEVAEDAVTGIRLVSYKCTLQGPRPTESTDHDLLRWLSRHELRDLDWAALDVETVTRLLDP